MKKTVLILGVAAASLACADAAWVIDSQAEWDKNLESQTGLEIVDGQAAPTAKQAMFSSVLKRFNKKMSAASIEFKQSPIWENWEPLPNVGPSNLDDAPVMLSLGPDNYWMFGRYGDGAKKGKGKGKGKKAQAAPKEQPAFAAEDATLEGFELPLKTTRFPNQFDAPGGLKEKLGGYHAWQSRDMVNWVHHGPVTPAKAKWTTTAEVVDGKVYIYYDFPNDQDPHLYIDEDLTDGVPGKNMGMVFKDPSHGSDCAFIRDLDGNFHVIAEDWSPIKASAHAWDSPLAVHAVSPDGINEFKILAPPVDERTQPTGKMDSYNHPHWKKEDPKNYKTGRAKYEIHKPAQNAYGDWAAISIGGQYYLFSDFDPAGGHGQSSMSVAWFTTDDINKPFTFCSNIGTGHPDPDIMFAEGKFYLATQTASDYVSPGPWVDGVDVRVGVDVSNDGKIDQWTDWQTVKERYEAIPGFAKQIAKTPAALDLNDLPAGYGFQFEIRLADTTENPSKPMIDQVKLAI